MQTHDKKNVNIDCLHFHRNSMHLLENTTKESKQAFLGGLHIEWTLKLEVVVAHLTLTFQILLELENGWKQRRRFRTQNGVVSGFIKQRSGYGVVLG